MTRFHIIFLISIISLVGVSAKSKSNYDLILEKIEVLSVDPDFTKFDANIKEVKGKNVMNVNFNLLQDCPPITVTISLSAFYNNKYNPIPINIKKDICEIFEEEFKLFEDQLKDSKIPTKCPIKKGEYYVKDFAPNIDNLPIPATLPWNKLKVNAKFVTDAGKVTANFDAYARLQKKSKLKITG